MLYLIALLAIIFQCSVSASDSFLLIESRELFVEELHEQGHTVKAFYHNWLQQKREQCVNELCQAFDITCQEWLELQEKSKRLQTCVSEDEELVLAELDPKACLIYSLIDRIWGSSSEFYVLDCRDSCPHFRGALATTFVFSAENKECISGRKKKLLLLCSLDLFNSLPVDCAEQMIKHELTHLKCGHAFEKRLLDELIQQKRSGGKLQLTHLEAIAYQNFHEVHELEADVLPALEGSESARIMEMGRRVLQASYVPLIYETLPTCLSCKLMTTAVRYTAPSFLLSAPVPHDHLRLLQCIHQDLFVEEMQDLPDLGNVQRF